MKHRSITVVIFFIACLGPRGVAVHPEKLGGDMRRAFQNPYLSYDQILRYSLFYLWLDQNFETLMMTWPLNKNPVSNLCYN